MVIHVCQINSGDWSIISSAGRYPNDANRVLGSTLGRSSKNMMEELGEQERGEVVHANLQLIALYAL